MIQGFLMGILAMLFGYFLEKIRLRRCLVKNFETINCFQIKDNSYDKEKYIRLKKKSLKSASLKEKKLKKMKDEYIELIKDNKEPDKAQYYQVNIVAIDRLLGIETKEFKDYEHKFDSQEIIVNNPIKDIDEITFKESSTKNNSKGTKDFFKSLHLKSIIFTTLIISIIFTILTFILCNSFYADGKKVGHTNGYSEGQKKGYSSGYDVGYDMGYDAKSDSDYYDEGYDDGYYAGLYKDTNSKSNVDLILEEFYNNNPEFR